MRVSRLIPDGSARGCPLLSYATAASLAFCFSATASHARPEWHTGLQPGLTLDAPGQTQRYSFHGSLEADVLFGRDHGGQLAFGPAIEIGSRAFADLRSSALGLLLLPLGKVDLGLGAGPQWQVDSSHRLAIAGRAFLGYRAFNYYGAYGIGIGGFIGIDHPLSERNAAWTVGLHLDGAVASLPFIAIASWLTGGTQD